MSSTYTRPLNGVLMRRTKTRVNTLGRGLVPKVLDLLRELVEDLAELHTLHDVTGALVLVHACAYEGA